MKHIRFEDLILHEDEGLIIINKPWDMASLDDKSLLNVWQLAKRHDSNLQLCHRLDKMTSGVLIIAKTPDMYREMAIRFEKREIHKTYHALVEGVHAFENKEINFPLLVTTNKKVSINFGQGKPSLTIINTEKQYKSFTILRCEPVTGRMHQIRAHLAAVRCPIVGDELYGGKDMFLSSFKRKYHQGKMTDVEKPLNQGYLLHARAISFKHPITNEDFSVEAPYSKHFEAAVKMLEKYNLD